ncbi:MAG: molybdate transport system ATP-binding protein [Planctomycetota bacterium]|jgi:molybdate transport system ATP-binding protein
MNNAGHCSIKLQRREFSIEAEFDIPARGVLGIFGHSGSGKTTLLRCLAGLEKDVQGDIKVNGQTWLSADQNLPCQARKIGFIFQESRLFPHLSVQGNLEYAAKRCANRNTTPLDRAQLLELLNIGHLLDRKPDQLSGGEKQRVAIGRALLTNPQIMLLDEPLASLDAKRKQEILPFLDRLHQELSIPMLYVSHSINEVSRLCDHLLVMEQGRIEFNGNIHDALVSAESPLAMAENAAALLEGIVAKQEKDFNLSVVQTLKGTALQVQGDFTPGQQLRLRVQATDVSLSRTVATESSILNIIEAEITQIVEEPNAYIMVWLVANGDVLLARISRKSCHSLRLRVKEKVFMQIKAVSVHSV